MTTGTKALTVRDMLEEKRTDIRAMLPTHVNVERFMKSALLAVARDKGLQDCTPLSLLAAVINAAELGLDFVPSKGHAYLIPFKNHGKLEAQFMPGYRGLIDLAKRSRVVTKIEAHLVCEKDQFELVFGTESKLYHKPYLQGAPGAVIGAYAVAFFSSAGPQFEFMRLDEIKAIQVRSKAGGSGPWNTDWNEMARKTVVRRIFKYLPSSPDIEKAIEADNRTVGLVDVELTEQPTEDGEMTQRLSGKLDNVAGNGNEAEKTEGDDQGRLFDDLRSALDTVTTLEEMQKFKQEYLAASTSRLTPEQHKKLIILCKKKEAALQ